MSIPVKCPGCSARLGAPDAAAGKSVKCPKCKTSIAVPAAEAGDDFEVVEDEPAPAPKKTTPVKAKPKPVVVDEDDERPRKKAKAVAEDDEDEDEDEAPRKKKGKKKAKAGTSPAVLYGGIAAGVLIIGGIGFAVYKLVGDDKPKDTANSGGGTGTPPPVMPGSGTPGPIIPGGKPPDGPLIPGGGKSIASKWKDFTAAEYGFKASFPWYPPPTPSPSNPPPEGTAGVARYQVQFSEPGGILTYFTVVAIKLKPGSAADGETVIDNLVKLLYLPAELKPSAAKQVTLAGKPATEVVYDMEKPAANGRKSRVVLRRLVTSTDAYIVYVHEHGGIQPSDLATFFDSFTLTK